MIRPLDMQMLLPRTESVGNIQHHENQQTVNANLNAADAVAREVQQQSETVVQKNNEFSEYQYDPSEEKNGTYSNPRRGKKNKKKSEDDSDSQSEEQQNEDARDKQPRINIQI